MPIWAIVLAGIALVLGWFATIGYAYNEGITEGRNREKAEVQRRGG